VCVCVLRWLQQSTHLPWWKWCICGTSSNRVRSPSQNVTGKHQHVTSTPFSCHQIRGEWYMWWKELFWDSSLTDLTTFIKKFLSVCCSRLSWQISLCHRPNSKVRVSSFCAWCNETAVNSSYLLQNVTWPGPLPASSALVTIFTACSQIGVFPNAKTQSTHSWWYDDGMLSSF